MNPEITLDMIIDGLQRGLIEITGPYRDPSVDETVAAIGEYWFYFAGLDSEMSSQDFLASYTQEETAQLIFEALTDMNNDNLTEYGEPLDEYVYYYYYLMENL